MDLPLFFEASLSQTDECREEWQRDIDDTSRRGSGELISLAVSAAPHLLSGVEVLA